MKPDASTIQANMHTSMRSILLLLALALPVQAACAEDGFYMGLAAALAKADMPADYSSNASTYDLQREVDDTGEGLKIYVGYNVSRYAAIEFGYSDFGKFTIHDRLSATGVNAVESAEFKGYSFDLSALGIARIGDLFSLYGRAGASFWNLEFRHQMTGSLPNFKETQKDFGISPLFGVGMGFRLHEKGTVRVEYQRYLDIGNDDMGQSDIDVISVGAQYHF
jgi:OOP family OmpA-OmpF porin